jgi:hypothetical protein
MRPFGRECYPLPPFDFDSQLAHEVCELRHKEIYIKRLD